MNLSINFEKMRPPGFHNRIKAHRDELITKVTSGSGWIYVEECPICKTRNSENMIYMVYKDITSFVCGECGCLYNDKIPKLLSEVYDNVSYLEYTKSTVYMKEYEYRKQRFGFERAKILESLVGSLAGKRVLDVGCGTGFFLDVARDFGAIVEGQEISRSLAREASERLGIKIFNESFESLNPVYKYDVITMFDLIEHVSDPIAIFTHAKNLLNSGGLIFVLTPNYRSLAFEALRTESNLYMPCEHLLFFSKDTVEYVAKVLDMDVLLYSTNGMDMFDMISYDRDINGLSFEHSELLKNINETQDAINRALCANHMRFVLNKR